VTVNANGTFTFGTHLNNSASYSVTVKTQPAGQLCSVSGGSGTISGANVTTVVVNCANDLFTIGGTLSGLATSESVVLQDNGGNNVTLTSNGTYAFTTPLATGHAYAVTVLTNPASPVAQTCTVTNGSGTVASANVTNVNVTCTTNTYTIGGSVTGLATGDQVVLQDNGGNSTTVSSNTSFTFSTKVASGATYAVSVQTNPTSPAQTCSVASGSGTVTNANVTNVSITCSTTTYNVGGTLTGLTTGGGNNVVLQDNAGDNLTLTANGSFTFATKVASGGAYAVTVFSQPSNPPQSCQVSSGTGTVGNNDVTTVVVNCANTYTIGGTVSGLTGSATVILQDNNTDNTTVTQNGSFTFPTPLTSGASYSATVLTQPTSPYQTCVVSSGTGTATANVTSISVACTTNPYTIGGTVTGLTNGESFTISDNGGTPITISANGNFIFPASQLSGTTYDVEVVTNPTGTIYETCTPSSNTGTVGGSNITSIAINCVPTPFTIGGNLTNLATGGTVVLTDNGGNSLPLTNNGAFTFTTPVASGATYDVEVLSNPTTPSQTCTATTNTGTVTNAAITTVAVNCVTNPYHIGGTLTGLATGGGNSITLQDNGGDNITLSANGTFQFPTTVLSGATYTVTVLTQPTQPAQTCSVGGATGTVGGADVTSVVVNCNTNQYFISGTVTGLGAGDTVVLQDNGGNNTSVTTGSFAFTVPIASGQTYDVSVFTNPTAPISQNCTVASGSGTVTNANITNVAVTCTTNPFTIGGTVFGLAAGATVQLSNNGTNITSVSANGAFSFTTQIPSGQTYDVETFLNPDPANGVTGPTQQVCTPTVNTGIVETPR
jgi:hypothetical protein